MPFVTYLFSSSLPYSSSFVMFLLRSYYVSRDSSLACQQVMVSRGSWSQVCFPYGCVVILGKKREEEPPSGRIRIVSSPALIKLLRYNSKEPKPTIHNSPLPIIPATIHLTNILNFFHNRLCLLVRHVFKTRRTCESDKPVVQGTRQGS